jgi:WD40 repeat protein
MVSPQRAIITLVSLLSLCAVSPHAFAGRSIELFLQLGHTWSVTSVAFSPDGTRLALGSDDRTVKLWEVRSGEPVRTLSGHTGSIQSVAFSPDGTRLASGSLDGIINIWDIVSRAIKVSMVLLPGNEWLAYHPEKWVYNSSPQGDEYTAIRFDHQLSPVYPLKYYRQELKQTNLEQALLLPQPVIEPKRFRLW